MNELATKRYGPSTTAAVVAFKPEWDIINTTYEKAVDPIVGKMTIRKLDEEVAEKGNYLAGGQITGDTPIAVSEPIDVVPIQPPRMMYFTPRYREFDPAYPPEFNSNRSYDLLARQVTFGRREPT